MSTQAIARRYAKAFFDLGQERDILAQLEQELRTVVEKLAEDPDLKTRIEHPRVSKQRKFELLDEVFSDRVSYRTMNLLRLLIEKHRETYIKAIYDEFVRYYDEARGIVVAKVRAATELDDEAQKSISQELSKAIGSQVRMELEVDPSLIGGLVVQVGDRRLDASVRGRLQRLRDHIAGGDRDVGVSRA